MRRHLSSGDDDQNELPRSVICWWRTVEEFDENGHFKIDLSDLTKLTPRLKLLREMERLAFVASEQLDLRHKLVSYRSGDFWLPVGGIKKEDMDIPPVVTILLSGLIGSGKSSLINMLYSVLGGSGLVPFAQTSSMSKKSPFLLAVGPTALLFANSYFLAIISFVGGSSHSTTMFLEEHNVVRSARSGFCVYDTRGLDYYHMGEGLEEVSTWMADGVCHNQPCHRPGDENLVSDRWLPNSVGSLISDARFAKRKVNCVMVVANLAEINVAFENGDLKSVDAIRDLFQSPCIRKSNENPILILTHGEMLKTEERINSRLKICEYLGIPETTGAYDIACLTEQGILPVESDPVTAFALTEAVYRSLMISDRSHLPKRRIQDWLILLLSWVMCCIASFFAILAHFFSTFGHKKKLKL